MLDQCNVSVLSSGYRLPAILMVIVFSVVLVYLCGLLVIYCRKLWKKRLKYIILYDIDWEKIPANRKGIFTMDLTIGLVGDRIERIMTGHIKREENGMDIADYKKVRKSLLRKLILERYEVFIGKRTAYIVKVKLYFENGRLKKMKPDLIELDNVKENA